MISTLAMNKKNVVNHCECMTSGKREEPEFSFMSFVRVCLILANRANPEESREDSQRACPGQ